jgi:hypothetical protein
VGLIVATALRVVFGLRRFALPELVARLGQVDGPRRSYLPPPRPLGRAVHRVLGRPPIRARCLIKALVLYRLLYLAGRPGELVIGMAEVPLDKDAHAWVEIDGHDVGPPPGRMGLMELVRYGTVTAASDETVADSSP